MSRLTDQKRYRGRIYHEHFKVSTKEGQSNESVETLKQVIIKLASKQTHWQKEYSRKRISFKRMLREKRVGGVPYLTFAEVRSIATSVDVPEEELKEALYSLHVQGELIFVKAPALQDLVILDIQWLFSIFKRVLKPETRENYDTRMLRERGVLYGTLWDQLWEDGQYPENVKVHIEALMVEFSLLARVPREYIKNMDGDTLRLPHDGEAVYLVPHLSRNATPGHPILGKMMPCDPPDLILTYRPDYPPPPWFLARVLASFVSDGSVCNHGPIHNDAGVFCIGKLFFIVRKDSGYIRLTAGCDEREAPALESLPQVLQAFKKSLDQVTPSIDGVDFQLQVFCDCKTHRKKKYLNDIQWSGMEGHLRCREWYSVRLYEPWFRYKVNWLHIKGGDRKS